MVRVEFVGTGEEFVFVDETSKNDHTAARRRGYGRLGEPAEVTDNFVRGERYSLAAAMTKEGYIATRVVPGSFDAEAFYDFIVQDVVSCVIMAEFVFSHIFPSHSSLKWGAGLLNAAPRWFLTTAGFIIASH